MLVGRKKSVVGWSKWLRACVGRDRAMKRRRREFNGVPSTSKAMDPYGPPHFYSFTSALLPSVFLLAKASDNQGRAKFSRHLSIIPRDTLSFVRSARCGSARSLPATELHNRMNKVFSQKKKLTSTEAFGVAAARSYMH